MDRILLSKPVVGGAEKDAVLAALDSGWVAPAGPDLAEFEAELARRTGRSHAVALSSGTAALHLALRAAGVGPGDRVACATLTFVASANAIAHSGARAEFVDCDGSGALDPVLLDSVLSRAHAAGDPFRAVLAVDLLGHVCDYAALAAVAAAHGAVLVSDAAESLGSERDGRPAGSFGELAAVSFNGNKIVTTSSGGAVLTDDAETAAYVRHLSTQAREPVPHYEHREIGYNYRLSNLLAALGRAQLARLDEFIAAKRRHRKLYRERAAAWPGVTVLGDPHDDDRENCWMTALLLDPAVCPLAPAELMAALDEAGIESRPMFAPMHLQPVYADRAAHPVHGGAVSEDLYRRGLLVPAGASVGDAGCRTVCDRLDTLLADPARPSGGVR